MKRWIAIFSISAIYYALAWYGLYVTDAGIVVTSIILYGFPSVVLAHYSYAPMPVIISVATLGLGIGVILEGAAHIYGLWYTIGIDEARLFGVVPVEVLITITLQTVFLALLYEMFFDDGNYTETNARSRFVAIGIFSLGAVALLYMHQTFFSGFFLSYSYTWLIGIMGACAVAALGVYRVYSIQFFDRLVNFTFIGAIPVLLGMFLAITNTHKVFANPDQYLYTISLYGEMVAFEELLVVLAMPFLVATIYELYLDDKN